MIPFFFLVSCLGRVQHTLGPSPASRAMAALGTLPEGVVYRLPLAKARVLSRFGQRGRTFHSGIDLQDSPQGGDPVLASREGVVEVARSMHGFGKFVDIRHADGWHTRYAHLKRIYLREGQVVDAGAKVGLVGRSGKATTPHLHFEIVSPQGHAVDPGEVLFKSPSK